MQQMNELDPKLQQFADRAVAEIVVPVVRFSAGTAGRARASRALVVLVTVVGFVLLASGAAVATGLFSEVFRIGNVSAAGSRAVTLEAARVAQLPLPTSQELDGRWSLRQVQLTMTDEWRSVELQYSRTGSRGMGIGVWSEGINVKPTADHVQTRTVNGVPVELGTAGDQRTARFSQRGATVIIRVFANEVAEDDLESLVTAWLYEAR
jgi:hypothetical protein